MSGSRAYSPRSESQTRRATRESQKDGLPLDWTISPVQRSAVKKRGRKKKCLLQQDQSVLVETCPNQAGVDSRSGGGKARYCKDGCLGRPLRIRSRNMSSTPIPTKTKRWRTKSANTEVKKTEKRLLSKIKIAATEVPVHEGNNAKNKERHPAESLRKAATPNTSCQEIDRLGKVSSAHQRMCVPTIVDMAGDSVGMGTSTSCAKIPAGKRTGNTGKQVSARGDASPNIVLSDSSRDWTMCYSGKGNDNAKRSLIIEHVNTSNSTKMTASIVNSDVTFEPSPMSATATQSQNLFSRKPKQRAKTLEKSPLSGVGKSSTSDPAAMKSASTNCHKKRTSKPPKDMLPNSVDVCTWSFPKSQLENDTMMNVQSAEGKPSQSCCPNDSVSLILDCSSSYREEPSKFSEPETFVSVSPNTSVNRRTKADCEQTLPALPTANALKPRPRSKCLKESKGERTSEAEKTRRACVVQEKNIVESSEAQQNSEQEKTIQACAPQEGKSPADGGHESGISDSGNNNHSPTPAANYIFALITDMTASMGGFDPCLDKLSGYSVTMDNTDSVGVSVKVDVKGSQPETVWEMPSESGGECLDSCATSTLCSGGQYSDVSNKSVTVHELEEGLESMSQVEQKLESPYSSKPSPRRTNGEKCTSCGKTVNLSASHICMSGIISHQEEGQSQCFDIRRTCFCPNRKRKFSSINMGVNEVDVPQPPCKRLKLDFKDSWRADTRTLSGSSQRSFIDIIETNSDGEFCEISFSTPEYNLDSSAESGASPIKSQGGNLMLWNTPTYTPSVQNTSSAAVHRQQVTCVGSENIPLNRGKRKSMKTGHVLSDKSDSSADNLCSPQSIRSKTSKKKGLESRETISNTGIDHVVFQSEHKEDTPGNASEMSDNDKIVNDETVRLVLKPSPCLSSVVSPITSPNLVPGLSASPNLEQESVVQPSTDHGSPKQKVEPGCCNLSENNSRVTSILETNKPKTLKKRGRPKKLKTAQPIIKVASQCYGELGSEPSPDDTGIVNPPDSVVGVTSSGHADDSVSNIRVVQDTDHCSNTKLQDVDEMSPFQAQTYSICDEVRKSAIVSNATSDISDPHATKSKNPKKRGKPKKSKAATELIKAATQLSGGTGNETCPDNTGNGDQPVSLLPSPCPTDIDLTSSGHVDDSLSSIGVVQDKDHCVNTELHIVDDQSPQVQEDSVCDEMRQSAITSDEHFDTVTSDTSGHAPARKAKSTKKRGRPKKVKEGDEIIEETSQPSGGIENQTLPDDNGNDNNPVSLLPSPGPDTGLTSSGHVDDSLSSIGVVQDKDCVNTEHHIVDDQSPRVQDDSVCDEMRQSALVSNVTTDIFSPQASKTTKTRGKPRKPKEAKETMQISSQPSGGIVSETSPDGNGNGNNPVSFIPSPGPETGLTSSGHVDDSLSSIRVVQDKDHCVNTELHIVDDQSPQVQEDSVCDNVKQSAIVSDEHFDTVTSDTSGHVPARKAKSTKKRGKPSKAKEGEEFIGEISQPSGGIENQTLPDDNENGKNPVSFTPSPGLDTGLTSSGHVDDSLSSIGVVQDKDHCVNTELHIVDDQSPRVQEDSVCDEMRQSAIVSDEHVYTVSSGASCHSPVIKTKIPKKRGRPKKKKEAAEAPEMALRINEGTDIVGDCSPKSTFIPKSPNHEEGVSIPHAENDPAGSEKGKADCAVVMSGTSSGDVSGSRANKTTKKESRLKKKKSKVFVEEVYDSSVYGAQLFSDTPQPSPVSTVQSMTSPPVSGLSDIEDIYSPGAPGDVHVSETIKREAGINVSVSVHLESLPKKKRITLGNLVLVRKGKMGNCYWRIVRSNTDASSQVSGERKEGTTLNFSLPGGVCSPKSAEFLSSDEEVNQVKSSSVSESCSELGITGHGVPEAGNISNSEQCDNTQISEQNLSQKTKKTGMPASNEFRETKSVEGRHHLHTVKSPKVKRKKSLVEKTSALTDFELAISNPVSEGRKKKTKEAAKRLRRKSSEDSNPGDAVTKSSLVQDKTDSHVLGFGQLPKFSGPVKSKIAQNILRKKAEDEMEKSRPQLFDVGEPVSFLEILHGNPDSGKKSTDGPAKGSQKESIKSEARKNMDLSKIDIEQVSSFADIISHLPYPSAPLSEDLDVECDYTDHHKEIPFSNFTKPVNAFQKTFSVSDDVKQRVCIESNVTSHEGSPERNLFSLPSSPSKLRFGSTEVSSILEVKDDNPSKTPMNIPEEVKDFMDEMEFEPDYEFESDEESLPGTMDALSSPEPSFPDQSRPVTSLPVAVTTEPFDFSARETLACGKSESSGVGFLNISMNKSVFYENSNDSISKPSVDDNNAVDDTGSQVGMLDNRQPYIHSEQLDVSADPVQLYVEEGNEDEECQIVDHFDNTVNFLEEAQDRSINPDQTYMTIDEAECTASFLGVTLDKTGYLEPLPQGCQIEEATQSDVEVVYGSDKSDCFSERDYEEEVDHMDMEDISGEVGLQPDDNMAVVGVDAAVTSADDSVVVEEISKEAEGSGGSGKTSQSKGHKAPPKLTESLVFNPPSKSARRKRSWQSPSSGAESSEEEEEASDDDDAVSIYAPSEASFLFDRDCSPPPVLDEKEDSGLYMSDTSKPSYPNPEPVKPQTSSTASPFKIPLRKAKPIVWSSPKLPTSPVKLGFAEGIVMGKRIKKSLLGEKSTVPSQYCPPSFFSFSRSIPPNYCIDYLLNGGCRNGHGCKLEHKFVEKADGFSRAVKLITDSCQKGQITDAVLAYKSLVLLDYSPTPEGIVMCLLNKCCKEGLVNEALDVLTDVCAGHLLRANMWTKLFQLFAVDWLKFIDHIKLLFNTMVDLKLRPPEESLAKLLRGFADGKHWSEMWAAMNYFRLWYQVPLRLKVCAMQSLVQDPKNLLPLAKNWIESQKTQDLTPFGKELLKDLKTECESLGLSSCCQSLTKAISGSLDPRRELGPRHVVSAPASARSLPPGDKDALGQEKNDIALHKVRGCMVTGNWAYLGEVFMEHCQDGVDLCKPDLWDTYVQVFLSKEVPSIITEGFNTFMKTAFQSAERDDAMGCLDKKFLAKLGVELLMFFYSHQGWKPAFDILVTMNNHELHNYLALDTGDGQRDPSIMAVEVSLYRMTPIYAVVILHRCFTANVGHFLSRSLSVADFNHCLHLFSTLLQQLQQKGQKVEIVQLMKLTLERCSSLREYPKETTEFASDAIINLLKTGDVELAEDLFNICCVHRLAIRKLVCRALLVACSQKAGWEAKVTSLYSYCKRHEVYHSQNVQVLPRSIMIDSLLTEVEMRLVLEDYLSEVYHVLCEKAAGQSLHKELEHQLDIMVTTSAPYPEHPFLPLSSPDALHIAQKSLLNVLQSGLVCRLQGHAVAPRLINLLPASVENYMRALSERAAVQQHPPVMPKPGRGRPMTRGRGAMRRPPVGRPRPDRMGQGPPLMRPPPRFKAYTSHYPPQGKS